MDAMSTLEELLSGEKEDPALEERKEGKRKNKNPNDESKEMGKKDNNSDTNSESESDSEPEFECKVCNKTFSGFIPLKQHEKSGKHRKAVDKRKMEKKLKSEAGKESSEVKDYSSILNEPFTCCDDCDKDFTGPASYYQHLTSKAHKKKQIQIALRNQVEKDGEIDIESLKKVWKQKDKESQKTGASSHSYEKILDDVQEKLSSSKIEISKEEESEKEFECGDCEKVFSGIVPFTQHIMSKVHEKKIKQKEMLESLKESGKKGKEGLSKETDLSTIEDVNDVLVCHLCHLCFNGPQNAIAHLKSRGHSKKVELRTWKEKMRARRASKESESNSATDENPEFESSLDTSSAMAANAVAKKELETSNEPKSSDNISDDVAKETKTRYENYKKYKEIIDKSDTGESDDVNN